MVFFGVVVTITYICTLEVCLHIDTFLTMKKSSQLELICESYASRNLTYLIDHHGTNGCHVNSKLLTYEWVVKFELSKIF